MHVHCLRLLPSCSESRGRLATKGKTECRESTWLPGPSAVRPNGCLIEVGTLKISAVLTKLIRERGSGVVFRRHFIPTRRRGSGRHRQGSDSSSAPARPFVEPQGSTSRSIIDLRVRRLDRAFAAADRQAAFARLRTSVVSGAPQDGGAPASPAALRGTHAPFEATPPG